jgi:nicotinate-nucleotide adenylyltransferase
VACEALWQLGLDELRLVPARRPPHKPGASIAPAECRASWLEDMVDGRPGLTVSRAELGREGPSYTADTLEQMARAEPGVRLWFVLGADQLEGFAGWRDPERILAHVAALAARVAPGRADILDVPPIGVSASMIRSRMAEGLPVGHLLPPPVEGALVREGLVPSPPVELRKEPPRPRSS